MPMKSNIKTCDLDELGKDLESIDTDQLLLVVDSRVWQHYQKALESYQPSNKTIIVYKSLEGENTKTISEYERGLEWFLEKKVHRKAHLLAIGGGATSDFAGFIAATLNRGIDWSVAPTTLLSMVDAAIGGKTGVNSKHGKNLIGAFHMPKNVWINPAFLETLSKEEMDSGKGEVIKYGFLSSKVHNLITKNSPLRPIIEACAQVKEDIVEKDFQEKGERICLNLGHTFGHALEKIYDLPHGVAVFWGMALIFKLAGQDDHLKTLRLLEKGVGADFGQPPWLNKTFPVEKIMEYVSKDKKVITSKEVVTVQIDQVGKFSTKVFKLKDLEQDLEKRKDELRGFNF